MKKFLTVSCMLVVSAAFAIAAENAQAAQTRVIKKAPQTMKKGQLEKILEKAPQTAVQVNAKEKRFIDVYFISKGYIPASEKSGESVDKPQLKCKAAVATQNGTLAVDGKCWNRLQQAEDDMEMLHMFVDLHNFGAYGSADGTFERNAYEGPNYGDSFYFASDLTEEFADNGVDSMFAPVKNAQNKISYFVFRKKMVQDGTQVQNAIQKEYQKNNWKPLTKEQLTSYFAKTAAPKPTEQTVSDNVL